MPAQRSATTASSLLVSIVFDLKCATHGLVVSNAAALVPTPVDYGEVVDMAETAEGLKGSIRAHEAERVKLLGELRVAETQGNVSGTILQQQPHPA